MYEAVLNVAQNQAQLMPENYLLLPPTVESMRATIEM